MTHPTSLLARTGLALAATAFGSAAVAADLPARGAPPPVVPLPVYLPFDGVYVGTSIGYMWTRASVRQPNGARGSYTMDGITGGRFAGRNWQMGSLVFGVEGELSVHEAKGRLAPGPTTGAFGDQLWSASGKARLGYAFGNVLPYLSGGVAVTELHQHSVGIFEFGQIRTHVGYAVGGGVEVAWTPSFSTRIEYEYANFGRENYLHDGIQHSVGLESHTVKAAAVFREVPGSRGALLTPGRGGSYVGAIFGATFANADVRRLGLRTRTEPQGFEGGLFGGYDHALGNGMFVGLDGMAMASDLSDGANGAAGPVNVDILWTGATRARFGMDIGSFSPYLHGGFTLAQVATRGFTVGPIGTLDVEMAYGGTVGAGVDFALSDRWFVRAEYAYSMFKDHRPSVDLIPSRVELDRHDFRIGLGYRLGDKNLF